ncbi:MAG: MBL fold metallo-hydrolase [Gemmatimonadetes bacterium]|nr:MBL fold metallo-hydrolase [Gemmatimonadota bacterium]
MRIFTKRRIVRGFLALLAVVAVALVVLVWSTDWLDALGAAPTGERLARIRRSPNFVNGAFQNPPSPETPRLATPGQMLKTWIFGDQVRHPPMPVATVLLTGAEFAQPPTSGLRATWLGHSTVLVEVDGARILFDPVWARRASPSTLVGPLRFFEPPLALDDLPPLDAVLATHDHYDHLDRGVVKALAASHAQAKMRFIVPLGVGAHLERWGVAPDRITELDWAESTSVAGLTLTATPARHFSGRGLSDRNHTLWASWSVTGPTHRVFHSGDTGPFYGFADIGTRYGPFDLTLMKIGAYGDGWPDIHLTPEQAVDAHRELRGKVLLPIHWGTFNLAYHAWNEPPERVVVAAMANGVQLVVPRPGESIEPSAPKPVQRWWR